jgi:chlorophyllide a hydrolase
VAIQITIWIYWLCCLIAASLIIFNKKFVDELLYPQGDDLQQKTGYGLYLLAGWIVTIVTSTAYVLLTKKYTPGDYGISDLVVFSISNGILEQFMFIFWFLLGCYIGKVFAPKSPKIIFISGYSGYAIFSGFIHALFWVSVLPAHKPVTLIMALLLAIMSLIWMWLVWRYRAVVAIMGMHIVIDFLTVGHLNFPWFESWQLI